MLERKDSKPGEDPNPPGPGGTELNNGGPVHVPNGGDGKDETDFRQDPAPGSNGPERAVLRESRSKAVPTSREPTRSELVSSHTALGLTVTKGFIRGIVI